ncbi:MAG: serine/threonine protein kinase [Myxococcales bacterium]|nr:serine/threonine protein kinase [Myxococcales bacterium]
MTTPDETLWIAPPISPSFPYRVLGKVGEGAMGEVFRAEDVELGRIIAIKRVKATFLRGLEGDDAERALKRFQQEARAAASVQHPGVTTVHAIGTIQGAPFIAMEWIDGVTLEERLESGPAFSFIESVRLTLELLGVLEAAHAVGVVHRDIKPGNLMLGAGGRLKVTDFGIARTARGSLVETQAGMIIGTPHYAAPEQLAGQSVDCRTDLYAAGVVFYELVTGQRPFDGETVYELILKVATAPVPAPSTVVPDLPSELDAFVDRALAKDPNERFGTAREMAEGLQRFFGGTAVGTNERLAIAEAALPSALAVAGTSPWELVRGVVDAWPVTTLPPIPVSAMLDRLLERPLHADAFSGALLVGSAVLLMSDCTLLAAFDPESERSGDTMLAELRDGEGARLAHLPRGADPRLVRQLAAAISPARPRMTGLQSNIVDLSALMQSLIAEGFDGVLRLERGDSLAFVLFSKGRRLLDVFGDGWPFDPVSEAWTEWVRRGRCVASVEEPQLVFPSITFRRRLGGTSLVVVRPEADTGRRLRTDTRTWADAITLQPETAPMAEGQSVLLALVDADPATALARWLVADLESQFVQFGRAGRWAGLVEAVQSAARVALYEAFEPALAAFDVTLRDSRDSSCLVATRAPIGDSATVAAFLESCVALRQRSAGRSLSAAVLVAPSFDDAALEAYMGGLARSARTGRGLLRRLTSHREGWLDTGDGGLHVLLVEEAEGRRRPLVPEQS